MLKEIATSVLVGSILLDAMANEDLASKATNPIGDLVQVQFQNSYSGNVYGMDGHTNTSIVQPVVPVDLPFKSVPKMITRTTIPYVRSPDFPGVGSQSGLGDTVFLAFALPETGRKGEMFGIGPALSLPTATEDELGSEQWSAGPAIIYVNLKTKGQMSGVMFYGLWNFAGNDDRENVAQINIQPIFNKFFADGWYVGIQDVPWTYNDITDKWTLPIGPRVGKIVNFGSQAVNIFGGAYYNPVDDNVGAAEWTAKISVSFLFPK